MNNALRKIINELCTEDKDYLDFRVLFKKMKIMRHILLKIIFLI